MLRMNFAGDPNLGLYGFATDEYCVVGVHAARDKIEKELKVKAHFFTVFNTGLLGIFAAGNSSGIVVPNLLEKDERKHLHMADVLYLTSRYTALGNLILMNDNGIILSPLLRKERQEIENFFGLRCAITKIAGTVVVGNLGIATNKGCLLHPRVKKQEMKLIEDTLGVEADIGTVNFGSPYPGAGVIANSFGFVASRQSSGPELGRITEALGFL
ncbi:MAG: translation initiation factor IF-6 [Candidatus Aenigmarchaeota archaeon]|nr:translation initiation factor IF-6 [Candidatus Aenigmarchaeota archaeon]